LYFSHAGYIWLRISLTLVEGNTVDTNIIKVLEQQPNFWTFS